MTVSELIERLGECDPDAEVQIEQTNDNGPEAATSVEEYHDHIVINGDLFR